MSPLGDSMQASVAREVVSVGGVWCIAHDISLAVSISVIHLQRESRVTIPPFSLSGLQFNQDSWAKKVICLFSITHIHAHPLPPVATAKAAIK